MQKEAGWHLLFSLDHHLASFYIKQEGEPTFQFVMIFYSDLTFKSDVSL